jgi:hypothetical protein
LRPIALLVGLLVLTGFARTWERLDAPEWGDIHWSTGRIAVESLPCVGACEGERRLVPPIGKYEETVAYDYREVTRTITPAQLSKESELSISVRLLLGEVGPSRLVESAYGLDEALAILDSIANRRDPAAYNPDDRARFAGYTGCGRDEAFATCANPDQYLGLRAKRALAPAAHIRPELLEAAVDRAVLAYWLIDSGTARGAAKGATSFVHRCGGAAYGLSTDHCDGIGDDDVAGAEPNKGPLVMRGPGKFLGHLGHYSLVDRSVIDYAID